VLKSPGRRHRISPMMRNLLPLLRDVGASPERCFFTNVYMGLRKVGPATGEFPGSRDPGFVERCRRFFLRQLSAQRPAVVLTLGRWVPEFLSPLSPELSCWHEIQSWGDIDAAGPVVHGVTFPGADCPACCVVALTHPSMRRANVKARRYGMQEGHGAEVAMAHEALAASGPAPVAVAATGRPGE
jgi:uracil-DNA glycosylase